MFSEADIIIMQSIYSLMTIRSNLLIWQCTPSKPVWHLQMYSLKTSPRLVGATTSHCPSFLQGLGVQGPDGRKGSLQEKNLAHPQISRTVQSIVPVSVKLQVSPPKPSAQIQMNRSSPTPVTHVPPLWQWFTSQ